MVVSPTPIKLEPTYTFTPTLMWHASRCGEWRMPDDCALATQTPAGSNVFIPHSRAHFTITEIELGNLIPHRHAWIEHMDFKVDVYLPAE
jgi:hypothetical protein